MICPTCHGQKTVATFGCARQRGRPVSIVERNPCPGCEGSGEITEERAAEMEAAKAVHLEQVTQFERARVEAAKLDLLRRTSGHPEERKNLEQHE